MSELESKKHKPSIVSAIADDGTIIELVFRPELANTALVIAQGETITSVPEWEVDGVTHVPVPASNNLIKHSALLLPAEAAAYESLESLTEDIGAYIRRYVGLSSASVSLCAAYVVLTWVYDAFNELPYLRFRGDYGTGKTRALTVVGALCYKTFFASGASTVSPIFHILDSFKGTLVFDEADFRFSDEKAELSKILNSGNAKGFPLLRTHVTPQKEFNPLAFSIFGPKIVGMRRSFEDQALESRFLTIDMEPGQSTGIPINLPEAQKGEALALRNKLLMYRIRNRLSVAVDPGLADPSLEPRLNQVLIPLLSVVPTEALRDNIRQAATVLQARTVSERSGSTEGQILGVLSTLLVRNPQAISVGEITAGFATAYGGDYERTITNRWVGSILRRLGISLYKSNGVFVISPGQSQRLAALCARYGIEVAREEEKLRA